MEVTHYYSKQNSRNEFHVYKYKTRKFTYNTFRACYSYLFPLYMIIEPFSIIV